MTDESNSNVDDYVVTFEPSLKGKLVEADGGSEAVGQKHAGREKYEGSLTGRKLSQGNPPWVFLELGGLTDKPPEMETDTVWCDEAYVYFKDK